MKKRFRSIAAAFALACLTWVTGAFSAQAMQQPLPEGWNDFASPFLKMHVPSSNNKVDIVGVWITHDGRTWAMVKCNYDEFSHRYHIAVSVPDAAPPFVTVDTQDFWGWSRPTGNAWTQILAPLMGDLKDIAGNPVVLPDFEGGKPVYYYPIDVTSRVVFGENFATRLDCTEVGDGHDTVGLCSLVLKDYALITVMCHYGEGADEKIAVEKAEVTIEPVPGIERPACSHEPTEGIWILTAGAVGRQTVPLVDGGVAIEPKKGVVTLCDFYYKEGLPMTVRYVTVDEQGTRTGELDAFTTNVVIGTEVASSDFVRTYKGYKLVDMSDPIVITRGGTNEIVLSYRLRNTDIPPTQNDRPDKPSTRGDDYPNEPGQPGNPGYKVVNDPDEPWEVTPDPKANTPGENPSDDPHNEVATTPDTVPPGGTTRVRYEVENDGEFRWDSLIQPGTGKTPASVAVVVDGVTNFVYVARDDDPTTTDDGTEWTPHVIHVEGDTEPGHPHVIELVFTNDDGDGASAVSIDDVTWLPAVPDEWMGDLVTKIDVPDTIAPEDPRRVVKVDNDNPSGWVPATYGDDGKTLVGVRTADGSELTKTVGGEEVKMLESTITINVTGTGELKIGEIIRASDTGDDLDGAEDGGTLAIRVDGKEYPLDPGTDPKDIKDTVITVYGGGNVEHTVEIVYTRESSDTTKNSTCEVRDIQWKTFAESDEGGSDWLKDEGVALWIVDHEERDDGRCYLAFEPQLKVKEEFREWLRRTRDNKHVYVKYGRTWQDCDACKPVEAFAREHRKEAGAYYADCDAGERDADKGWMWIQVDLPKTTVRPLGYWRVYIDEAEIAFTKGGRYKVAYVDAATGEPIPGIEPLGPYSLPAGTLVNVANYYRNDIPGYELVAQPEAGTIETDKELTYTYRYEKVGYRVNYLEEGTDMVLAPQKVVPLGVYKVGDTVTEKFVDIDGYVLVSPKSQDLTLAETLAVVDGRLVEIAKNEITFYYKPIPPLEWVEYTVRCICETGELLIDDVIHKAPEGMAVTEYAPNIDGYVPYESKITFDALGGETIVFVYYYVD